LYVVNLPEMQARVMLAGYTPQIHADGFYKATVLAGEWPFGEWRQWRSLRPPRDPDLPDLVAELEAFVDRWRPRALSAAANVADPDDRAELTQVLGGPLDRTSRTARAKAWVACVENLYKVPVPFYQDPLDHERWRAWSRGRFSG
jgi:hypothetical protein